MVESLKEGATETGQSDNLGRLVKFTLRIIGECDRNCSDCFDMENFGSTGVLSQEHEDVLIEEVASFGDQGVKVLAHVTGGELLLHPRSATIVERLLGSGALVSIITSGCTGYEVDGIDIDNLNRIAEIKSQNLTPILSSKVTLPKWRERLQYSAPLLANINGLVKVRHTIYESAESVWDDFVTEQGYRQISRQQVAEFPRPIPTGFYRKDIIVAGEQDLQALYLDESDNILQVHSHHVIKAGRAVKNMQVLPTTTEKCVYLNGRRVPPYLDIWPNGSIYPCFVIGREIPELSLGKLSDINLVEALAGARANIDARRERFACGDIGPHVCDRCR